MVPFTFDWGLHGLAEVPLTYNGVYSKEVLAYKLSLRPRTKWIELEEKVTELNTRYDEYKKKKDPAIGMTKDEVINSKWGKPGDTNTTITQYGTTEQWVYRYKGYIYFENGIVTSIQMN